MDAILDSALVAGLIMAAFGVLVLAAALGDHFTRTEQPRRCRYADSATDCWREDTDHFFHPDGRVSTAVAFARSINEDRGVVAPGPLDKGDQSLASRK